MLEISEFASLMRDVAASYVNPIPVDKNPRGARLKVTEQMCMDVIEYSRQTGSVARVVAYHFGISQTTVSLILREHNGKSKVTKMRA